MLMIMVTLKVMLMRKHWLRGVFYDDDVENFEDADDEDEKRNTDWGVCTMMMVMMVMMVMMKKNHRQRGVYYWVSETERSINQCSPLDPQTQDDAGDPHDDGDG